MNIINLLWNNNYAILYKSPINRRRKEEKQKSKKNKKMLKSG